MALGGGFDDGKAEPRTGLAAASAPRQNRSNASFALGPFNPAPWSLTDSSASPFLAASRTVTSPFGGPWSWAFSTRFSSMRVNERGSPSTVTDP